jgi:hypothetical protein
VSHTRGWGRSFTPVFENTLGLIVNVLILIHWIYLLGGKLHLLSHPYWRYSDLCELMFVGKNGTLVDHIVAQNSTISAESMWGGSYFDIQPFGSHQSRWGRGDKFDLFLQCISPIVLLGHVHPWISTKTPF